MNTHKMNHEMDETARKHLYELEDVADIAVDRVNDHLALQARKHGDKEFFGYIITMEKMRTCEYNAALPTPHEERVVRRATTSTINPQHASLAELAAEMQMLRVDMECLQNKFANIAEEVARRTGMESRDHLLISMSSRTVRY